MFSRTSLSHIKKVKLIVQKKILQNGRCLVKHTSVQLDLYVLLLGDRKARKAHKNLALANFATLPEKYIDFVDNLFSSACTEKLPFQQSVNISKNTHQIK